MERLARAHARLTHALRSSAYLIVDAFHPHIAAAELSADGRARLKRLVAHAE